MNAAGRLGGPGQLGGPRGHRLDEPGIRRAERPRVHGQPQVRQQPLRGVPLWPALPAPSRRAPSGRTQSGPTSVGRAPACGRPLCGSASFGSASFGSGSPAIVPGHQAPYPGAPAACSSASSRPNLAAARRSARSACTQEITSAPSSQPSTSGTGTAPASPSQDRPRASAPNPARAAFSWRAGDLGERDPAIGQHAPVMTDAMLAAEIPAIPQPGAEQLLELRRHAPGPGRGHPALAGWAGSSSASWAARPAAAGWTRPKASS